ncbi:MAG: hypothetical protein QG573_707 [Acidobacteriota bacterium]|nr:hypothetical protein [Acidobacteriota bacterium]
MLLLAGALWMAGGGCRQVAPAPADSPAPSLHPRRFDLRDFLASRGSGVDSPEAALRFGRLGRNLRFTFPAAQPQTPYVAPAGFRIAAVAPRGDRIALVRDLDPDSTEVLLHDRARGETRLLLPVDRDARFLPQRFSDDGGLLFLYSDEGDDTLQLEILNPDSGERSRRRRPGCEVTHFDAGSAGAIHALQWSCDGRREAALFDTATGAEAGPLPLPRDTRLARALPGDASEGVLYEVASGRFPRDLVFAEHLDPDAAAHPLTFGLAPAIAAEDLVDPVPIAVPIVGAATLPAELWWPRRTAGSPPALLWIEDDAESPAWMEFHPFLQFLANRGVAVLRLRLRGARGFGRTFRHAADGRLVEAGLEDLEAARAELARRGVDPQRIAVLGEGAWPGAIAATALAEGSGRFAAAIDLGGDPDPLRQQDLLPTLVEPARTWWLTRLGDPTAEPVRRERERIRAAATSGAAWVDAAPGTGFDELSAAEVERLWEFLASRLAVAP